MGLERNLIMIIAAFASQWWTPEIQWCGSDARLIKDIAVVLQIITTTGKMFSTYVLSDAKQYKMDKLMLDYFIKCFKFSITSLLLQYF